jgi:anaerobic selenocysteine-containing dehydrogenase
MDSMEEKEVRTYCRLCFSRCSIVLQVQNGKILAVKAGKEPLCPMGSALGEIVHASDRLLHPLRKEGSGWRRISWDEALRFIAERLEDIRQRYGPQALDIHAG